MMSETAKNPPEVNHQADTNSVVEAESTFDVKEALAQLVNQPEILKDDDKQRQILGMISIHREYLRFKSPVSMAMGASGNIAKTLSAVEISMQ